MARSNVRIIVLAFCGVLCWATNSAGQGVASQTAQPTAVPSADIVKLQGEALVWLQDLIRINTTNPPGNEVLAAKYIAEVLKREGIPSEIFESTPGRGILVARLSSSALPNPSRALLLLAHLDVVGVDKAKWSMDPFAAVIKDGYLYGRGAIDDKGMLAANLAVFIALKRSQARLNRDVIFLAEGDEEAGGETGMKFAVEKHWDKIASGFALNECGRTVMKNGKVQYVAVQVSEKVAVNVNVIATGTSGHGSVPLKDNAVTHLSAAMAKLGRTKPRYNSTLSHADISKESLRFRMKRPASGCRRWKVPTVSITQRDGFRMPIQSGTLCCETPSRPQCCRLASAPMLSPRKPVAF
jgi:acetylornithine deacetylase/succinyl-diaminopimelate desuccinylase-like protein